MHPLTAHSVPPSLAKKSGTGGVLWRRMKFAGVGTPITIQNDHYHRSDYGPAQLALFVAATIVLVIFVWTYVH